MSASASSSRRAAKWSFIVRAQALLGGQQTRTKNSTNTNPSHRITFFQGLPGRVAAQISRCARLRASSRCARLRRRACAGRRRGDKEFKQNNSLSQTQFHKRFYTFPGRLASALSGERLYAMRADHACVDTWLAG